MNVVLHINYRTHWGQKLVVLTNSDMDIQDMIYEDNDQWALNISADEKELRYRYAVVHPDGRLEKEVGMERVMRLHLISTQTLLVYDSWREAGQDALMSSPFTSVFFQKELRFLSKRKEEYPYKSYILTARASCIPTGCRLCVVGSDTSFGKWDASKALLMEPDADGTWFTSFVPQNAKQTIYYKYALYDLTQRRVLEYESIEQDRQLKPQRLSKSTVWYNDEQPRFSLDKPKGAGVAIPVFSLRSNTGYGVGQFSDLKLVADWAEKTGLSLIQVLPINDTTSTYTWTDSYPYSAISVFALHPLYLDLSPLESLLDAKDRNALRNEQIALNGLTQIDYERVIKFKWKYIRLAYSKEKEKVFSSKEYRQFFEERKKWLVPYAAFCFLRDKNGTAVFSEWKDYAIFSEKKVLALSNEKSKDYDAIAVNYYVQFLLHKQLKDAADYAREKGVIMKGDIPIGISRNSCDAWVAPELYNMDVQAGAPPDAFSTTGQNWGFPTYNWQNMAKDGYGWWRMRLHSMSEYFDTFRIDHILGFFRIWEIPLHSVEGLLGYFSPALPLSASELISKGVWFNANRLCMPYITSTILQEIFGKDAKYVQSAFMEEYETQQYRLKEEFNTQKKIEDYFLKNPIEGQHLKAKLFDLINDVVLIEDKYAPAHYHPRIAMHYTRSYRDLDGEQKRILDVIYIDYFYKRNNDFWWGKAMEKLPAIRYATNMLVCGEDLGMVPASVPDVMRRLSLLSLIVQRMPNDSSVEFAELWKAPYLSVCSPSSHDTSGLREWWEEDRAATQRFFNNVLGERGEAPITCEPWIVNRIIQQHLSAPSMWTVFPVQDLLAMDKSLRYANYKEERINLPANPKHYWRYRIHLPMEELIREKKFNDELRNMVMNTNRLMG